MVIKSAFWLNIVVDKEKALMNDLSSNLPNGSKKQSRVGEVW